MRIPEPTTSHGVAWAVYEHLADEDIKDPRAKERMNREQRLVLAINVLRTEVNADGFDSYFHNEYADLIAIEAAQLLGPEWHALVTEAFELREASEEFLGQLDEQLYDLEEAHPADEVLDRFVWTHKASFFGPQA
ncbi:DUF4375 domain-containing protein [Lentzea sp. NPDC051838]|uniref:DMP19 family protein n=1 Tax=Lentzea sp. NPDC051838 TaxID=3154849 RepID=UPI00341EEE8B